MALSSVSLISFISASQDSILRAISIYLTFRFILEKTYLLAYKELGQELLNLYKTQLQVPLDGSVSIEIISGKGRTGMF